MYKSHIAYLLPLLVAHDLDAVLELGQALVGQPLLLLQGPQGIGKAVGTRNRTILVEKGNHERSYPLTAARPSVTSSRWFPSLSPLADPPEPELELIIASCRLRLADDSVTNADIGSSGIVDAVESCIIGPLL